jgi:hypothetical protein
MNENNNYMARFFGVMGSGKAYLSLLYNFLAFPLGLFYFVFLVVGFSISIPLILVFVGLLLLPVMVLAWWFLAAFERQLAIILLGEEIGPMAPRPGSNEDIWQRFKNFLGNPVTWKSLVYLFLKFPLGILSLVAISVFLGLGIGFTVVPILAVGFNLDASLDLWWGISWPLSNPSFGMVVFFLGLLVWPVSLHVFNGLGMVHGWLAKVMLGDYPYITTSKRELDKTEVSKTSEESIDETVVSEGELTDAHEEEAVDSRVHEPSGEYEPIFEEVEEPPVEAIDIPVELSSQKVRISGSLVGEEFGTRTFTRKVSDIHLKEDGSQVGRVGYKSEQLKVQREGDDFPWEAVGKM